MAPRDRLRAGWRPVPLQAAPGAGPVAAPRAYRSLGASCCHSFVAARVVKPIEFALLGQPVVYATVVGVPVAELALDRSAIPSPLHSNVTDPLTAGRRHLEPCLLELSHGPQGHRPRGRTRREGCTGEKTGAPAGINAPHNGSNLGLVRPGRASRKLQRRASNGNSAESHPVRQCCSR